MQSAHSHADDYQQQGSRCRMGIWRRARARPPENMSIIIVVLIVTTIAGAELYPGDKVTYRWIPAEWMSLNRNESCNY